MTNLIRLSKWVLLLISAGWALYSSNAFILLAQTFPTSESPGYGTSELLATLQGYAVVFGPAMLAAILLMIRWPENKLARN